MSLTGLAVFVVVSFVIPIPILVWLDRRGGGGHSNQDDG